MVSIIFIIARCDYLFILLFLHFALKISAMKPHEIQEKLGLTRIRDRNWYVQPCCATAGDGLYEGLTWLTSNHKSWWLGWHLWLLASIVKLADRDGTCACKRRQVELECSSAVGLLIGEYRSHILDAGIQGQQNWLSDVRKKYTAWIWVYIIRSAWGL